MTPSTLLILPGWQDSGPRHWQSLWLQKYRDHAIKVVQRDWMNPKKEEWVRALNDFILKNRGEIILVGHSLACATIAHWSNEYGSGSDAKIKGALLVSPSDMDAPDFPEEITGFSPMPLKKLTFRSIVVASSNDRWVSEERAKYFAERWGAEFVNIGPHGHINADAGFGEWPEGEQCLQELMK